MDITGVEYDSRRVKPGMIFIVVQGYRDNGARYIPDAVKNGAAAILAAERLPTDLPLLLVSSIRKGMADVASAYYNFPGRKSQNQGVTGTNGKSTSVFLIHHLLTRAGFKTGMINSLVYDTGRNRYKAERTTPESVDMQRFLAEMLDSGCTHGVLEVSSHALILNRVENIDFRVGLFTTFSRDHLDFHQTMEDYLAAKKLLLKKLTGPDCRAVLNLDVPEFAAFREDSPCPVITYGLENKNADITAGKVAFHQRFTEFEISTPEGRAAAKSPLLGRYNLVNTLGAIAAGTAWGIELSKILKALESLSPVPGRFQAIDVGQPFAVIVDFAHTPDAIERLCRSAREITKGKLLLLFGCGGDRDRGKRPLMAEAASRLADYVILTSDNPRTEDPSRIIEDAKAGLTGKNYIIEPDRHRAINLILEKARPGDTVLLAGKGAEDYQEIEGVRHPFSDTRSATETLENLGFVGAKV